MKPTLFHRTVIGIKEFFQRLDKALERRAKLKQPAVLPGTMKANEALEFLYERYFGDEPVIDTGCGEQAYPRMVEKLCDYIDRR